MNILPNESLFPLTHLMAYYYFNLFHPHPLPLVESERGRNYIVIIVVEELVRSGEKGTIKGKNSTLLHIFLQSSTAAACGGVEKRKQLVNTQTKNYLHVIYAWP